MQNIQIGKTYYLNKKFSYPVTMIGTIILGEELYMITKASPLEDDNEVVVKLLKYSTIEKGLKNGTYTETPLKTVKERNTVLNYNESSLVADVYEVAYDDALVDVGLIENEDRNFSTDEKIKANANGSKSPCEKEKCDFVDEDMKEFCETIGSLFGLKPTSVLDVFKDMSKRNSK